MRSSKGDSRKPVKHKGNVAVDFLCLLSVNGDVRFRDAIASCKNRNHEKEEGSAKQQVDTKALQEQQIVQGDEENTIKQTKREESEFLEKAVGKEAEKK